MFMKRITKAGMLLCLVTFIAFTGCKKATYLGSANSGEPALSAPHFKPSSQDVRFVLEGGNVVATGAIQMFGSYTMHPVIVKGATFHCTNNLVSPEGTITALSVCEKTTGTWRIVDATGIYTGLRGNGTLFMYSSGETWTGKIY
jgi:hypothetical protein